MFYQGEPVAAVAADTEEQAIDAARLVKVTYDVLQHVADGSAGDGAPMRRVGRFRARRQRAKGATRQETGNLEEGFKQAAHIVEQTYPTHVITHVCMESHGCVCEWDGDKLTAWVSTQGVHGTQGRQFAQGLKIPQRQRPRHHAVHGRRVRQQVRARTRRG